MYFRYRVKPGQEDRYQSYLDKVLPVTERDEPYITEYEILKCEDGSYLQHERYSKPDDIAAHMSLTADGQADFIAATELIDLKVVGEMSSEFWEMYGGPHATAYSRFKAIKR